MCIARGGGEAYKGRIRAMQRRSVVLGLGPYEVGLPETGRDLVSSGLQMISVMCSS